MQLRHDRDAVSMQLITGKRQHFRDRKVDIHRPPFRRGVPRHRADATEHFARALAVADNFADRVLDLVQIGRREVKEALASPSVGADSWKRLNDLTGDRWR